MLKVLAGSLPYTPEGLPRITRMPPGSAPRPAQVCGEVAAAVRR
ncbi:hypothetical protein AB0G32_08790 [Streptomyces sp. NPDC023723]